MTEKGEEEEIKFASNDDAVDVEGAKDEEADEEADGDGEEKPAKTKTVSADAPWSERMWEVFSTFWPLGLVAFGGPQVITF